MENLKIEQNKGYLLAECSGSDFYISGALHIEKDDLLFIFQDDAEACIQAEKDGINFIYDIKGVPHRVYIDTPENRAIIESALKNNPNCAITDENTPMALTMSTMEHDKQHHLWYGGTTAVISYKGIDFIISATGDVNGSIYVGKELATSFKDKSNNAVLYQYLPEYANIKNDVDLEKAISYDYVTKESLNDKSVTVFLDNSNWWTVEVIGDDNYIYEVIDEPLNATTLKEAILEVEENIDTIYENYLSNQQ